MFFAASQGGFVSPLELSGVGARDEVKRLQQSLLRLAHLAQRPNAHPGTPNGVIGEQTMISVGGVMDILQNRLPHWVIKPLQDAMMLGASSTEAKNVVGRYVTELRFASDQAGDYFARLPGPDSFPQPPSFHTSLGLGSFFQPGWYADPPRLAIVGGLILLGIWLYARARSR